MFNVKELKMFRDFLKADINEESANTLSKIESKLELVKDYNKKLWELDWDYGRCGSVQGVFKATQEEMDNLIGKHLWFGEILGKHSEVQGVMKEEYITLISDDPLTVIDAEWSGYDPFDYVD